VKAATLALGLSPALLLSAMSAGEPATASFALEPAEVVASSGAEFTITVEVDQFDTPIGGWTVDLVFDSAALDAVSCDAGPESVCNPDYAEGKARITGASASGIATGDLLAEVSFVATGPAGTETAIDAEVVSCKAATIPIEDLACSTTGASVSIGQGATHLFEGWTEVGSWPGSSIFGVEPIIAALNGGVSPNVWESIAGYREGEWRSTFKNAPLGSFNTLTSVVSGESYWLYVTAEADLSVE
jgi:Cohesin domain